LIQKGGEIGHLKVSLHGRKEADHVKKSTNKAAQKSRKTGCPPDLKTRPLFPLGWVFSTVFLVAWELTKQLNV